MKSLTKFRGLFLFMGHLAFATPSHALVNGSFESGLTGWTVAAGSVLVNPYPATPSDGTKYVMLGGDNRPATILSQVTSVTAGSSNRLSFDIAATGSVGRFGIIRVDLTASGVLLVSRRFTNSAQNTFPTTHESKSIPFTVPASVTNVTLIFADISPDNGVAVDPVLDNVHIIQQTLSFPPVLAGPITNSANGHTYFLLSGTNWTASQAQAVSLGGNLVTINNEAEQVWVYTNFSSFGGTARALWIGLSDRLQEGKFVWASGQTNTYRNWATFEPNDYGGLEHYVHIFPPGDPLGRSPKWNDYADWTNVVFDDRTVPLHGVVEIEGGIIPPPDCTEQVALLTGQLATANTSNAVLRTQVIGLTLTNANLRAQISSLQNTSNLLRSQLTNAHKTISLLEGRLSTANNTVAELKTALAAAQAANVTLRSQLNAARLENAKLQNQLDGIAESLTSLEDFFADEFRNPAFFISGASTELQVSNLVSAIKELPPAQQRVLMKLLNPTRPKQLR